MFWVVCVAIEIRYWILMFWWGRGAGGGHGLSLLRFLKQNHGHQMPQHPWQLLKFPLLVWGGAGLPGLHPCLLLADQACQGPRLSGAWDPCCLLGACLSLT